jgi:hypothetical protein
MIKASLLATASVFLIGTASAQNNCNANPDQPFCQGGGEYDDTELRERITQNETDIGANRLTLEELQLENAYQWQDISILNDRTLENRREHVQLEGLVNDMADAMVRVNNASVDRDNALGTLIDEVDTRSEQRDGILRDNIEQVEERLDSEVLRLDARIDAIVVTPYDDQPLWEAVDDLNGRVNLLGDQVTNNTVRLESIERSVEELRDEVNAGLAGVAAMGSIPTALAGRTSVGVGYGNWAGESAFAVGASTRSENGRHAFTASGTTTNESAGFSAGYSFSF